MWIGIVFAGLIAVSATLAQTRLVLMSLLHEPAVAALEEPVPAG